MAIDGKGRRIGMRGANSEGEGEGSKEEGKLNFRAILWFLQKQNSVKVSIRFSHIYAI